MDEDTVNSECVVADYMNDKIHRHGFTCQNLPTHENEVTRTLRPLYIKFEPNEEHIDEICRAYAAEEINSDSYMKILSSMIDGELSWGRVVAIFAFAGALAVNSLEMGHESDVEMIREWTCSFMHTHVDEWIASQGGWKELVKLLEQTKKSWMAELVSLIVRAIVAAWNL